MTIVPRVLPSALELVDQRLALQLADLLVVERDVVVDVGVGDEPVVADDRTFYCLGLATIDAAAAPSTGSSTSTLAPLVSAASACCCCLAASWSALL